MNFRIDRRDEMNFTAISQLLKCCKIFHCHKRARGTSFLACLECDEILARRNHTSFNSLIAIPAREQLAYADPFHTPIYKTHTHTHARTYVHGDTRRGRLNRAKRTNRMGSIACLYRLQSVHSFPRPPTVPPYYRHEEQRHLAMLRFHLA